MRTALLASSIAAALAAAPAAAQSRELGVPFDNGRGVRECRNLRAFVQVAEPGGRALRGGPGDEFPLLGRLYAPGAARRVPVDVTATFEGWLRVRGPAVEAALPERPESSSPETQDVWILGHEVTAVTDSSRGYAFPRGSSRIALWTSDGRPLRARARLVDIVACDDFWIFGRWQIGRVEGLRYIHDLRRLAEPVQVTAWTPKATTFPSREDQRRAIGDWLVESYDEEEASRAGQLSRVGEDFSIRYYVSYWHGNGSRYVGLEVVRPGHECAWVDDDFERRMQHWRPIRDVAAAAREVRGPIARRLEACGATPAQVASALQGFEAAFDQVAAWDGDDTEYIRAVGRWIENVEGQGAERELHEE